MAQEKITVEYARQKLGERGKKLTDREINNLLSTLSILCNKAIDNVIGKNL